MFDIFRAEDYEKALGKLDNKEKQILVEFETEIAIRPYRGKPLSSPFLREKKFDGKRALFLIDDISQRILFITITDKKEQKKTINRILNDIESYKEELRNQSL